ncbi:hypothetical protein GZ77_07525 [Endozoicomonas montiporae]|uniref:Lipoprotein n=2 Tax=Endozoicomonas montiporae TaxID=1027273 RepID=A0A081N734_9GAMM|nr:hypothetical protein [Endozoicomonas montiporae]AMO55926.1 hypothetical protein EZMO1_1781 [Endozoicomonas montiporae CL-33]KEQ14257.1 hypothetical protein GZ77_07525 [Endozoicomonas montiporae]
MKPLLFSCLFIVLTVPVAGCSGCFLPQQPTKIAIQQQADGRYGVVVKDCTPYALSDIKAAQHGCYVENSRFQSMVNPEKILPVSDTSDGKRPTAGSYELQ